VDYGGLGTGGGSRPGSNLRIDGMDIDGIGIERDSATIANATHTTIHTATRTAAHTATHTAHTATRTAKHTAAHTETHIERPAASPRNCSQRKNPSQRGEVLET